MHDHSNSPFLTGEVSKAANPAVARYFRGASLAAHHGSVPRNSSTFKLSEKLAPGRAKQAGQIRAEAQINGKPSPRRKTRVSGFTTD